MIGQRYAPLGVQQAPVVQPGVQTVVQPGLQPVTRTVVQPARPTSEVTIIREPATARDGTVGVGSRGTEVVTQRVAQPIIVSDIPTEEVTVVREIPQSPPSRRTRRVTIIEPEVPSRSPESCPPCQGVPSAPCQGVPSARIQVPRKGVAMSSVTEAVSRMSLEEELVKNGYVPLERIIVNENCGPGKSRYVRAQNKVGQIVFVLVDVDGYIGIRPQDLTMVESKNASVVPYSIKRGAYECAQVEVSGVAFDCKDAVCIVAREDGETPKETNFIYAGRRVDATAVVGDDIISYPVIRLSEIRANPDLVLCNTMAVTARIQRAAWAASERAMLEFEENLEKYLATFRLFKQYRCELHHRWVVSMKELEEPTNQFLSLPQISATSDIETFHVLQHNLARRNTMFAELLRTTRCITEHSCQVQRNTQEIIDLTNCCLQDFKGVETVIPPE